MTSSATTDSTDDGDARATARSPMVLCAATGIARRPAAIDDDDDAASSEPADGTLRSGRPAARRATRQPRDGRRPAPDRHDQRRDGQGRHRQHRPQPLVRSNHVGTRQRAVHHVVALRRQGGHRRRRRRPRSGRDARGVCRRHGVHVQAADGEVRQRRPITPDDVKHTFERLYAPDIATGSGGYMRIVGADEYANGKANEISGITTTDDTITFKLEAPDGSFPYKIALPTTCPVGKDAPLTARRRREPADRSTPADRTSIKSYTPEESMVWVQQPELQLGRAR